MMMHSFDGLNYVTRRST